VLIVDQSDVPNISEKNRTNDGLLNDDSEYLCGMISIGPVLLT
jgi:hypothetical protein